MDMSPATQPPLRTPAAKRPESYEECIPDYGIVTVVEDFLPGVDRLLLDFEHGVPLPQVTLDMGLENGSTAVMGDGRLMVVLRGVTGVATTDVELRKIPAPVDFDGSDEIEVIAKFDPDEDVIEILYDPQTDPNPVIEVSDFADRLGAVILFNGKPILAVHGAQGLAADEVVLVARGPATI